MGSHQLASNLSGVIQVSFARPITALGAFPQVLTQNVPKSAWVHEIVDL